MTATGYVTTAGVEVAVDGTVVATRDEINIISGTNMQVTGADNSGAARVDVTVTSTAGGAGPSSTVVAETSYGLSSTAGAGSAYSRGDHTHGSPALTSAAATTSAVGDAAAVGTATAPARADHTHGREAFGAPGSSAVGDVAAAGAATTVARSDHTHGREAFGAVTAQTSFGAASGNGTATTVAHSDHTHGTPSLASTSPTTSGVGDAAAAGVGSTAAKADHTHGREGFGAVTGQTSYGAASANGSAATVSHSDHTHGTPPLPYTVVAFNVPGTVAAAVGAARIYNDSGRTLTIQAVRSSVGTAPTGQALLVDINKNGTTIFTTQANRPSIAAAANTSGKVTNMDVTSLADGDYLTVDVDQVGSGVAGSDLTVQVWVA